MFLATQRHREQFPSAMGALWSTLSGGVVAPWCPQGQGQGEGSALGAKAKAGGVAGVGGVGGVRARSGGQGHHNVAVVLEFLMQLGMDTAQQVRERM